MILLYVCIVHTELTGIPEYDIYVFIEMQYIPTVDPNLGDPHPISVKFNFKS